MGFLRFRCKTILALVSVGVLSGSAALAQQEVTYTGEAAAASASVLGILNASISDTGPLPNSGGSLSTQLANFDAPGLLDLQLLSANTDGENNRTNSQASVAQLQLTVAGVSIAATILSSTATAACYPDHAAANGGSTLAALTVNGQSIKITGAPNQTVPLLVGSLIINEQITSIVNSPFITSADIVVNALHLRVNGIADVRIATSHSGVSCIELVPE